MAAYGIAYLAESLDEVLVCCLRLVVDYCHSLLLDRCLYLLDALYPHELHVLLYAHALYLAEEFAEAAVLMRQPRLEMC